MDKSKLDKGKFCMKDYMKIRRESEKYKTTGKDEKEKRKDREYQRKRYNNMDEDSKERLLKKKREYMFNKRHNSTLEYHIELCKKDKFRKMAKIADMTEEDKV